MNKRQFKRLVDLIRESLDHSTKAVVIKDEKSHLNYTGIVYVKELSYTDVMFLGSIDELDEIQIMSDGDGLAVIVAVIK